MSLNTNEQKQFQSQARAKLAKASSPIEKIRFTCLARGASGINGLSRQFKILDDNSDRKLCMEEFKKGCHDFGCDLSNDEIIALFKDIDADNSGSISFDEFLLALRPSMSQSRVDLIKRVFTLLDKSGDGVITSADLRGVYNAKNHPKYQNGEWTEQEVFKEYLKTFECGGEVDGKVTWEEFMNYYSGLSSSVDNDVYFDLMVRNAYKI